MPWEVRYFSHAMDDYTKITEWFMSIDENFETEKRDDMYIYSPGSVDKKNRFRNRLDKYLKTRMEKK